MRHAAGAIIMQAALDVSKYVHGVRRFDFVRDEETEMEYIQHETRVQARRIKREALDAGDASGEEW